MTGKNLAHYKIITAIGAGGMGEVCGARHCRQDAKNSRPRKSILPCRQGAAYPPPSPGFDHQTSAGSILIRVKYGAARVEIV
jgi:hypothetical protein